MCFAAAAVFVFGPGGPSPCSLNASVASLVKLEFPPLCAVQGCNALLQPLPLSSALSRRRARSTRALPASLRWLVFYRFARCRAASALLQPLPLSSAL
eukprot:scaffold143722_cov235-Phaeocystis_antarctica.AAC.1